MASVWGELKRRNVVKVTVAYAIVAWLLVQIIVSVEAPLSLPDWTDTLVIVFLLIGFVVAVFLAWAYELTPEGVKQTKLVPLSESVAEVTGRRLDFAIIGALALALGFVVVDNYVLPGSSESSVQTGDVLPSSVAVLPFENLSPNADDAYFAAGLHEELLNQLSKLHNLSVISRTSVLRYTDSGLSIPEIAAELNVGTVMEGNVRYANDRVRITLQLIDAATDEHLWSETYDREFADIFAIETDIAFSVARALEAEFSLGERENIERLATSSPAAYQLYLQAFAVPSGPFHDAEQIDYLNQALAIDPEFALAYARKSYINVIDEPELGRLNAERALQLDPSLGLAYRAIAAAHVRGWRAAEARQAYERALELSPNDSEILSGFSQLHTFLGEHDEAIGLALQAVTLDPNSAGRYDGLGGALEFAGDLDGAAEAFLHARNLNPRAILSVSNLARLEAGRGNEVEAVRFLEETEQIIIEADRLVWLGFPAHGYALAGFPDKAFEFATRARATGDRGGDGFEALVSLGLEEREEALEYLNRFVERQGPINPGIMRIKFNVWGDPALDEPEFADVRRRIVFAE